MKRMFIVSMLISLAMICSCQKQDSTVEAQLAQRKTALDSREQALDEREKAVAEREKALVEKERALANIRPVAPDLQSRSQIPDDAQAKAERDRRIQQLPPEFRALIPDRSRMEAEKAQRDRAIRERAVQTQPDKMSGMGTSSDAKVPDAEETSPSASPTPQ
jgi:hypothetical protein